MEQVRKAYGLERPIPVQYAEWIGRAVRGDLGDSFFLKVPVAELIADRLPVTLTLGVCALAFALALSLPLGVLAAVRHLAEVLDVLSEAEPTWRICEYTGYCSRDTQHRAEEKSSRAM